MFFFDCDGKNQKNTLADISLGDFDWRLGFGKIVHLCRPSECFACFYSPELKKTTMGTIRNIPYFPKRDYMCVSKNRDTPKWSGL